MFKYSLEVLKGRKREIEAHLADIYAKNGGILGVLEAQTQIHDLDDAIEMLEGVNSELLKDDLLENVEGNAEKESRLAFGNENLSFESEEEAYC